ncbi:MAG: hypothetical protein U9R05_07845 [Chloroflexota bacterium]|nr:hypothetical protein [Chloroflexota bacterium]
MTKKSRKKRAATKLSKAQRYHPGAKGVPAPAQNTKTSKVRRAARVGHSVSIPTDAELTEEYRYVLTDLKRIGLLALAMLALLIVLAVILV